jgi:hypothetical protein
MALPDASAMTTRRRGRTENPARLSLRRLRVLAEESPPVELQRPIVRGDCSSIERPCVLVGCSHNLFLDVNEETGAIKFNHPDKEPGDIDPEWSCALDVADRGEQTRDDVGRSLNLVPERIRQIFRAALSKMHLAGGPVLRLLHEASEPTRAHSMADQLDLHATGKGGVETGEHPEGWRDVAGTNRGVQEAIDLAEAAAWANEVQSYVSEGFGLREAWTLANVENAKHGGAAVAREAHNLEAVGSIPAPATKAKGDVCRWCQQEPAVVRCRDIDLCEACHVAKRLAWKCPHFTTDEAIRLLAEHQEREKAMSAKKPSTKAPSNAIKRKTIHEMLPCPIPADVIAARSAELAITIREREDVRLRKRAINADFREKLNFFDERLKELGASVEGGTEKRSVECVEYLLPTNEIQIVRVDTGEVVRTRTADAADLQEPLPGTGESAPKRGRKAKAAESQQDAAPPF